MPNIRQTQRLIERTLGRMADVRPTTAKLIAVDGKLADIQVGSSPAILRNVEIRGNPDFLLLGNQVTIQWVDREGSATEVPVVLADGGPSLMSGGDLVVARGSGGGTYSPDEVTLTGASGMLAVKGGGIGLQHLSFTPSLAGHTHTDSFLGGGWTVTPDGILLSLSGATAIHPTGQIALGLGNEIIKLDSLNATYRLWAGNTDPTLAPFSVSKAGAVKATSGTVGGWVLGTNSLTSDTGVVGMSVRTDWPGSNQWRFWAGNADPALAPFRVDSQGNAWIESAVIDVTLQSDNYQAGLSGWMLNDGGFAEFGDVRVRGEIVSSVFKYNELQASAGTFGVWYSGSTLYADATIPVVDQTVAIDVKNTDEGAALFRAGDILRIKTFANAAAGTATISHVASANNSWAATTTPSISKPAGVATNDVLIAHIVTQNATVTGSGWTEIRTDNHGSTSLRATTLYKVAGASEPASYSFTLSASQKGAGGIAAFRGVNTTSVVDIHGAATSASDATIEAGGVTTTLAKDMLVWLGATAGDSGWAVTPPAGMAESWDVFNAADGASSAMAYAEQLAAGASGNKTGALTGGTPTLDTIAVVGSPTTSSNVNPVGSFSINKPSGVAAGHVLLCQVLVRYTSTVDTLSGWTLVRMDNQDASGFDVKSYLFRKVAGASEPSSYTWTISTADNSYAAGMIALSGVDNTTPVEAQGASLSGNDYDVEAPSITTLTDGAWLLFFGASNTNAGTTFTPPSGMTERWDVHPGDSDYLVHIECATELRSTAGATGTRTATLVGDNGYSVGQVLALKPATISIPAAAYSIGQLIALKASTGASNGIRDLWLQVGADVPAGTHIVNHEVYTTYTCTVKKNLLAANVSLKAGTSVIDWGQANGGYILLSADDPVGRPFLRLAKVAADPWNGTDTLIAQIGNLKGLTVSGTLINADRYGAIFGNPAGDHLSYNAETADGFVIKAGTSSVTLDGYGAYVLDNTADRTLANRYFGVRVNPSTFLGGLAGAYEDNMTEIYIRANDVVGSASGAETTISGVSGATSAHIRAVAYSAGTKYIEANATLRTGGGIYIGNEYGTDPGAGNLTATGSIVATGDIYSIPWTDWSSSVDYGGWTSFSGGYKYVYYKKIGKLAIVWFYLEGSGASGDYWFRLPVTQRAVSFPTTVVVRLCENGTWKTGIAYVQTGTNYCNVTNVDGSALNATQGTKIVTGEILYEVA